MDDGEGEMRQSSEMRAVNEMRPVSMVHVKTNPEDLEVDETHQFGLKYEALLASVVQEYRVLYDNKHPDFLRKDVRANTWEQVGHRLMQPGEYFFSSS